MESIKRILHLIPDSKNNTAIERLNMVCSRCGVKCSEFQSRGEGFESSVEDFDDTLRNSSSCYMQCTDAQILHLVDGDESDVCVRCGVTGLPTTNEPVATSNAAFEHHLKSSGKFQACTAANSEEMIRVKDPFLRQLLIDCLKTLDTKGADYTAGNLAVDRLWNFREVARQTGEDSMRKGWFTYFFKHYTSIVKWVRHGQVESEPIRGRVIDMINYLYLMLLIEADESKVTK